MAGCWSGRRQAARGRTFRVVFVPGLAERIFPQRLREDALLLDARRAELGAPLAVADTRADDERLQLRLAVGAAAERIHLSYPRLELAESRPRVPSFYVLDVLRATTGRIPRYKALSDLAFENGRASLDWPAPPVARGRHRRPRARPGGAAAAAARAGVGAVAQPTAAPATCSSSTRRCCGRCASAMHAGSRHRIPADGLNRVVDLTRPALDQAAAHRAPVLADRAAALRRLPVPVPARRHLPAGAARGAGAAAAPRSAHQGQPVPRDPDRVPAPAAGQRDAAGDRGSPARRRGRCSSGRSAR